MVIVTQEQAAANLIRLAHPILVSYTEATKKRLDELFGVVIDCGDSLLCLVGTKENLLEVRDHLAAMDSDEEPKLQKAFERMMGTEVQGMLRLLVIFQHGEAVVFANTHVQMYAGGLA